ncbi:MAG: LptF/LptG family permease [Bacteroidales bacterium]
MKKLDWYVIKKFLGTYVFSILLIISIAVVFDINENLDKFLSKNAPVKAIALDYYANFVPFFANMFSPLFTFIAVIFFTSKLADNSEVIAMLSCGMSFKRLLRPYIFSAFLIAAVNFYLSSYVIPQGNVKMIEFQNTYMKNKKVEYATNIQMQVDTGVIAYMERYDNPSKTAYRFSLEKFEGKQLKSRLTAQSAKYNEDYKWTMREYLIRDFNGMTEVITKGSSLDTIVHIEPQDFLISYGDEKQMTTPRLYKYIEKQRMRGIGNIKDFEIEYERRFAMSLASFILTIIGAAVSARKVKGGMGLNIGIGLGLSFGYILFMTVTSSFAVSGQTSPRVAVWIPNIIYAGIAYYLYRKAPN